MLLTKGLCKGQSLAKTGSNSRSDCESNGVYRWALLQRKTRNDGECCAMCFGGDRRNDASILLVLFLLRLLERGKDIPLVRYDSRTRIVTA